MHRTTFGVNGDLGGRSSNGQALVGRDEIDALLFDEKEIGVPLDRVGLVEKTIVQKVHQARRKEETTPFVGGAISDDVFGQNLCRNGLANDAVVSIRHQK